MNISERQLQQIGGSLLVTLPKSWTSSLHLKKGSPVKMLVSEQGNLTIAPELSVKKRTAEAEIIYDSDFVRKFFKEYFEGNESIKIVFQAAEKGKKKEIYDFLKRFMNVQIVEESESSLKVRCFKIEELSMEECLRRMFHLSLSMMEGVRENAGEKTIQEVRDTMTRFYYILVMQVRRFLSEGKYTEENQIPLIRAMDIRMVAEKIQRVGEIVSSMHGEGSIGCLEEAEKYYEKSMSCFIKNDFEKALPLWNQGKEIADRIKRKKQKNESSDKIVQILRFGKEISMLVR